MLAGGYVYIHAPAHPYATKRGYVMEHRLVIERSIERLTLPTEHVHHKDGNRNNNRLSNLELLDGVEHNRRHAIENKLGKNRKA